MTAKEIMKRLRAEGWIEKNQKGSHKKFKHPNHAGIVIVPDHKGDVPVGTLHSIFKQAGWK